MAVLQARLRHLRLQLVALVEEEQLAVDQVQVQLHLLLQLREL
jgi:hypothetical protein